MDMPFYGSFDIKMTNKTLVKFFFFLKKNLNEEKKVSKFIFKTYKKYKKCYLINEMYIMIYQDHIFI